jgi:hypothetical protein
VPRQGVSLLKASAEGLQTFSLPPVSWEVRPEPEDAAERATLVVAVERALAEEAESAWWRSGLDDLGVGPAPKGPWAQPGESGGG